MVWLPSGFIGYANAWQAFFPFFKRVPRGLDEFLPLEERKGSDANGDSGVYYLVFAVRKLRGAEECCVAGAIPKGCRKLAGGASHR